MIEQGKAPQQPGSSNFGFWISNIGMVAMTGAFAVAGVSQVVLERRTGIDFLEVQKEVEPHFLGLVLAAALFSVGIFLFVLNFIRYGRPTDEALGADPAES